MPVTTRTRRSALATSYNAPASGVETSSSPSRKKSSEGQSPKEHQDAHIPIATTSPIASPKEMFLFQGVEYNSYSEMVEAKREYNRKTLLNSGLLGVVEQIRAEQRTSTSSTRGLAATKKKAQAAPLPRRKSNRLAGVHAEEIYVEEDWGGKFVVKSLAPSDGAATQTTTSIDKATGESKVHVHEEFYKGRVNDGTDLSIEQAVSLCGEKWQTSLVAAQDFLANDLTYLVTLDDSRTIDQQSGCDISSDEEDNIPLKTLMSTTGKTTSKAASTAEGEIGSRMITPPKSTHISSLLEKLQALRVNDEECVAKVTPERIYSVSFHPSSTTLIACAGDKNGYLGFWNVDRYSSAASSSSSLVPAETNENDGVHLFKPHSRPITHLEWDRSGTNLYSISYDCSIRKLDVHTQIFSEVFAAYDNSAEYKGKLGYGIDEGYRFWIQYGCLDPRHEQNMIISTSTGHVLHLDFRSGERGHITFNKELSEKKINTMR